jgi:outer membrane receptor protein involved in Fe transport
VVPVRILSVLCVAWTFIAAPSAAEQSARTIAIAAQPLAQALAEFAEQTGLQVIYVSEIIGGRRSNLVPSDLAPSDALARMLEGTGLRFEFLNPQTVRIFAGATRSQPAVRKYSTLGGSRRPSVDQAARLDEVLVTATRRMEEASSVPISMVVWSQEAMVASGVKGMPEIGALTPGVGFDWRSNIGSGVYTIVEMRGVTGRHGVSTGIFIDDTPLPAGWLDTYGRSFPSIFDFDRVEVLRGPQGTLLGQGTLGGAIRFIPSQPSLTAFSSRAVVELATTEHGDVTYEAGAAAGGPLRADVLGFRVAGWYRSAGGFVDRIDPFTGATVDRDADRTTAKSARIATTLAPPDSVHKTPARQFESYGIDDTSAFNPHLTDPDQGQFRNANLLRQPADNRFTLATVKATANLGVTDLVAVSSLYDVKGASTHDFTCLGGCDSPLGPDYPVSHSDALGLRIDVEQQMFAQEVRLSPVDDDGDFTWLVGAFYAQTKTRDWIGDTLIPRKERDTVHIDQTQLEGFAQFSRRWGRRFAAGAGWRIGRASYDYVHLPTSIRGGHDETPVMPRFDLSYRTDAGRFFYLAAAKGYRSGGLAPCGLWEFPPDEDWSYEVGSKSDFLEGRAHLDASVFHVRWRNGQEDPVAYACAYASVRGKAVSNGLELTGRARLTDRMNLDLALTYTDAHYTQPVELDGAIIVRDGDAVHGARPPLNVTMSVDYELPLTDSVTVNLRAEDIYRGGKGPTSLSDSPASPFYVAGNTQYRSTNLLNLRATFRWSGMEIGLYMNNALDTHPIVNNTPSCGCSRENPIYEAYTFAPRTVGISTTWRL